MQSEPNESLRDLPKQQFDLNQKAISAEMEDLGKMYSNFSSGQR